MLKRRAPPNIVLTVETRRKFASLASLFINVDKRNGKKSRSKKNGKTELSYKDIGSWCHGPLTIFRYFKQDLTTDIGFDIILNGSYFPLKQDINS